MNIATARNLLLGRRQQGAHRQNRVQAIVQGLVTAMANRAVSIIISFISVPLTIHYLGAERYGAWTLIFGTLGWLRLADVGVGNGVSNAVASAFGAERPDLIRAHVSTAFALLSALAAAIGLVFVVAWPWIEWNSLFNVKSELAKSELGPAMAAAIAIFLVGFPLSISSKTYAATQSAKLANYWGTAGTIGSLVALVVITQLKGGLVALVIGVWGVGLAIDLMSTFFLFVRHRPAYAPRFSSIRRESVGEIFNVGIQFFLIQILALIVFDTGNFVIAHFLGAEEVPAYNLTYKLFNYTSLVQSMLFSYVWLAYTEAIARRDIDWVRKTFRRNVAFSLLSTAAMVVPLVFIARPLIRAWAGSEAVPTAELVCWMAAWTMINAFTSPLACLLAAAGRLKWQLVYSTIGTAAIVVLSLYLVRIWQASGVIAAPVIAYLIFFCIPLTFDVRVLFRRLADDSSTVDAVPANGGAPVDVGMIAVEPDPAQGKAA